MSKKLKRLMAAEYNNVFADMPACVVVTYQGMDAETTHELRGDLRKAKPPIRFQVVKNTIISHVMGEHGVKGTDDLFTGTSAVVYGGPNPVELSKKMLDWARKMQAQIANQSA